MKLKNVVVRNFLYDYQSLIYVEKDNLIRSIRPYGAQPPDKTFFHFGNFNAEAKIIIQNSKFIDCSFRHGAIYSPSIPEFLTQDKSNQIYFAH